MFIVPTYKRPKKLKNLVKAYKETKATEPVYVLIQGNAELYDGIEYPDTWTIEVLDKNLGLVAGLNYVYKNHPDEPYYGIICDDQQPNTEYWDKQLIEATTPWNMVTSKDTLNKNDWRMSGITVYGGDLIRFVDFVMPPCTWHICGDDWWELVSRQCKNWVVVNEAKSTHITPETTGIAPDETYKTSYIDFDKQVAQYNDWLETQGNQLLAKISQMLKEI
jgi:hypothetical protein